jgi:DNA invertase Pin-like site-specific DNA recombinase
MLASVAQWEREAIGERTAAALAVKAERGERVGAVPYGYALATDGVRLEVVPAEQVVIAAARTLRAAGCSLRAIANKLAARGYVSRTGRPFAAMQVSRMLEVERAEAA